jgi:hypothetical protein
VAGDRNELVSQVEKPLYLVPGAARLLERFLELVPSEAHLVHELLEVALRAV